MKFGQSAQGQYESKEPSDEIFSPMEAIPDSGRPRRRTKVVTTSQVTTKKAKTGSRTMVSKKSMKSLMKVSGKTHTSKLRHVGELLSREQVVVMSV